MSSGRPAASPPAPHCVLLAAAALVYACVVQQTTAASTPMVTASVNVHKGRVAYLQAEELFGPHWEVPAAEEGVICKVEVMTHEPVTLRVGRFEPSIFDCSFPRKSVKYIHNGNPLLIEDSVKLIRYVFKDSAHTEVTIINLKVMVIESPYDIIVKDPTLRDLEIKDFYGLSNPLDSSILRFRYNYYNGAKCTVQFNQLQTKLPLLGHIVTGSESKVISELHEDCRDFLLLGLRYKHRSPPTPDRDYLPLRVEVIDPSKRQEVVEENIYLKVPIKDAFPNMPPKIEVNEMAMIELNEFTLTAIDPQLISAKDEETAEDQLVFNISRSPEFGYFVHLGDPDHPITSFVQSDLSRNRIAYRPPRERFAERKIFDMEVEAYDSLFAVSDPVVINIAIDPVDTSGPRIAANRGLVVSEGGSRAITEDDLFIVDYDNIDDVEIFVKGGLRHGKLQVNGNPEVVFTPIDIREGKVVYFHDGSENISDKIILRISDGNSAMRTKFPIKILPEDNSAPYLITNEDIEVSAGGSVQITSTELAAHDKDSDDNDIVYVVKKPPIAGEIVKKYQPMTLGSPVSKFSQLELSKGYIYYHHLGGGGPDGFEVRLIDSKEKPNKSGKYSVTITVKSNNDRPPEPVPGMSRQLIVKETEVAFITKKHLAYADMENGGELFYTVTSQPFFLTTSITIDAGRIIATDGATVPIKDPTVSPIRTFTQQDIETNKVAYMPPIEDMGPIRRHAQFIFSVSDKSGNKLVDQTFDITIVPVNNQIPHMSIKPIMVQEGGAARISTNEISAYDPDTDQGELVFSIKTEPKYGRLMHDDMPLVEGEQFTIADLAKPSIRYDHEGSEAKEDSFELTLSDGDNHITKTVQLSIQLANDQPFQFSQSIDNHINVEEGGEVKILPTNLVESSVSVDAALSFVVLQSPSFGEIRLEGHPASEFELYDLFKQLVTYSHFGGEIGTDVVHDLGTFAVFDDKNLSPVYTPLVDLNITIMPIDNKKPTVVLGGPLFAEEGKTTMLTNEVLSAKDPDTPLEDLMFHIIKQPMYGFIENTNEKNSLGIAIDHFSMVDLKDGNIHYVQSNYTNFEPSSDEFELYIADGIHDSSPVKMDISILPRNDEEPEFTVDHIIVSEGGSTVLNSLLSVKDKDKPKDRLVLSVAVPPSHGSLVITNQDKGGRKEVSATDIPIDELNESTQLMYRHDNSEHFHDQFTLKLTDGVHVARQTANVKVIPINDEVPKMIQNTGVVVNIDDSVIITEGNLYSTDVDNDDDEISYIIVSIPQKGKLQYLSNITEEWITFQQFDSFTQEEISKKRIRYIQTEVGPSLLSGDNWDRFIFQLTDGSNPQPDASFDIEIIPSVQQSLRVINKGIEIKEGDTRELTTDILSATDDFSKPQDLKFFIIEGPTHGNIAHINDKNNAINQFNQGELEAMKIVYIHNAIADDLQEDAFKFAVLNSLNQSRTGVFHVLIEPVDEVLPTLASNVPLTVIQGDRVIVTANNLKIEDPDTPRNNLTYTLIDLPKHGVLLKDGRSILAAFTQKDIDEGNMVYQSDSSDESGIDYFLFMISDGKHDGYLVNGTLQSKPAFFSILIQPKEEGPPKLVVNQAPSQLSPLGNGRYGFIITENHLKAVQRDTPPDEVTYVVDQKPEHGELEHVGLGRVIKKKFTQKDVNDGAIMYVLVDTMRVTNDSFVFRVHDENRNTLSDQRFSIEWSVVEFPTHQYIVCEDTGVLMLPLMRLGSLKDPVTVRVKTRGMSATAGLDFEKPKISEITFEPGVTHAVFEILILSDIIEETNEKLKVVLKTPQNAILGQYSKMVVQLIDYKNGHCADYIGMVTRDHPDPLNLIPDELKEAKLQGSAYTDPPKVIIEPSSIQEQHVTKNINDEDFDIFSMYDTRKKDKMDEKDEDDFDEEYYDNYEDKETKDEYQVDQNTGVLPFDFDAYKESNQPEETTDSPEVYQVEEEDIFTLEKQKDDEVDYDDKFEGEDEVDEQVDIFDLGLQQLGGWDGLPVTEKPSKKSEHPLKKYRESRKKKNKKNKKRRKGKKDKGNRNKKNKKSANDFYDTNSFLTTAAPEPIKSTVAPQECTPETKGLLFFEYVSSNMWRCNGREWEKWGWGTNYLQAAAAMLNDEPDPSSGSAESQQQSPDCEKGYQVYGKFCYRPITEKATWLDAEARCQQDDAHLAHVESQQHLHWLWKLTGQDPFWIGLNARLTIDNWHYTDSEKVTYYNWREGFPRKHRSLDKNCVMVAGKGMWVNRPCYRILAKYICTQPVKSAQRRKRHRNRNNF